MRAVHSADSTTGSLIHVATAVLPAAVVAAALASCAGCGPRPFSKCEGLPAPPAIDGDVVWHKDVRPIVEGRCARCHVDGGLAPFPLTTYDEVKDELAAVGDAVASRRMPPWMPAKCCNTFKDDPSLTPLQIATVTSWIAAGAPEGDANDVGAAIDPVGELARVDATLAMDEAYVPDVAHHDDTRCFILDWPFDKTKFVTGFGVTPGARAQVHHVLVVLAPGSLRQNYRILDDGDDTPGWSCPGGLIGGVDDYIGGWSPGWEGETMPAGTGHRVDADDVVILTVHYTKPHDDVDITEDQTAVDVMLEDSVEDELTAVPVMDASWAFGGLPIPSGADDVEFAAEYDPTTVMSSGRELEVVGVNLHMHERGKSGVVGIRRADGGEECVVQIDDYDHAWQGDYTLDKPMFIAKGDLAYVECHFDNSAGHQRIVDGVPEEPRDLNWAEDGEMCVGYLTIKRPR